MKESQPNLPKREVKQKSHVVATAARYFINEGNHRTETGKRVESSDRREREGRTGRTLLLP